MWQCLDRSKENPLFLVSLEPFLMRVTMTPPPPDAPHIFRFANETKFANALSSGGFHTVGTSKQRDDNPWPGSVEECWEATRDLAAPFKKLIEAVPSAQMEEVTREVLDGIRRFQSGENINLPATVTVAVGIA